MAASVWFEIDRKMLARIDAIFIRGESIQRDLWDLSHQIGEMMVMEARARLAATGSADDGAADVYRSLYSKTENINEGVIETVGSTFVGYPSRPGDLTGSAAQAASRQWATLAHRIHYGYYPGAPRLRNPYNPRAGITEPNPFLTDVWDRYARQRGGFVNLVASQVIDPMLRGRRLGA